MRLAEGDQYGDEIDWFLWLQSIRDKYIVLQVSGNLLLKTSCRNQKNI